MARTFTIRNVSGSKSVSLINTGATGFIASRGGFGPVRISDLISTQGTIAESYTLNLKGSSHDNAASQLSTLIELLDEASQYARRPWRNSPIYLEQQATNETNKRYARVIMGLELEYPDLFDLPFETESNLETLSLTIVREHPWSDHRPGDIGSALTLSPMWDGKVIEEADFDSVTESGSSTLTDEMVDNEPKLKVTVDASQNEAYGKVTSLSDETRVIARFRLNPDAFTVGAGDSFQLFRGIMDAAVGGSDQAFRIGFGRNSADEYFVLYSIYVTDGGTTNLTGYLLDDVDEDGQEVDILVDYYAEPNAGDDGGYLRLYVNGTLAVEDTGLDNDQRLPDELHIGAIASLDAGTSGSFYLSDIWYAFERDAQPTRAHVANYRGGDEPISAVVEYDNGTGSTTLGLGDDMFPATVAQNDAFRFKVASTGDPLPRVLVIPALSTAGDLTTTTLALKYYNGAAWTALTLGTNYLVYPGADLEASLEQSSEDIVIVVDYPSDATDDGSGYFLEIEETNAAPVYATNPALSETEYPYAQVEPYIELPADQFGGDRPMSLLLRLRQDYGGDENEGFGNISRILVGAKSRGLEKFVSHLNAGAEGNPGDWTVTQGTDATKTARPDAPGGYYSDVDFSGDSTMQSRVQFSGSGMAQYWEGEYIAIVRVQQSGGSAGDINVKLRTYLNGTNLYDPHIDTPEVSPQGVDEGYEWLDLGLLNIPFSQKYSDDTLEGLDLIFQVLAERTTGSATLEIVDLILIPVDEAQVGVDDLVSDLDYGPSALRGSNALDIDSGLIDWRAQKYVIDSSGNLLPTEQWILMQKPLELENLNKKTRLFFALEYYPTTWDSPPLVGDPAQHVSVEVYAHKRYAVLRGND